MLPSEPPIPFLWQEHDGEGRLITAEFPTFYLLSVYVPNAGRGLVTLDKRKEPSSSLKSHLRELKF
jgi:exonuclease III